MFRALPVFLAVVVSAPALAEDCVVSVGPKDRSAAARRWSASKGR